MTTNETHDSTERVPSTHPSLDWAKLAPEAYKAMVRLDTAAKQGVDPTCSTWSRSARRRSTTAPSAWTCTARTRWRPASRRSGSSSSSAWTESKHFYTAKEIAAIELTEAITVLTDGFVPDEVYARAASEFDETELARLIVAITTINAWNRFGVSTRWSRALHAGP